MAINRASRLTATNEKVVSKNGGGIVEVITVALAQYLVGTFVRVAVCARNRALLIGTTGEARRMVHVRYPSPRHTGIVLAVAGLVKIVWNEIRAYEHASVKTHDVCTPPSAALSQVCRVSQFIL